jgi:hypothetical protein
MLAPAAKVDVPPADFTETGWGIRLVIVLLAFGSLVGSGLVVGVDVLLGLAILVGVGLSTAVGVGAWQDAATSRHKSSAASRRGQSGCGCPGGNLPSPRSRSLTRIRKEGCQQTLQHASYARSRAKCRRMNSAANDLEVGLKPTFALSCRRFQPMAHRVRGAVGGPWFVDARHPSILMTAGRE